MAYGRSGALLLTNGALCACCVLVGCSDEDEHILILTHSVISGKKQIALDGVVIHKSEEVRRRALSVDDVIALRSARCTRLSVGHVMRLTQNGRVSLRWCCRKYWASSVTRFSATGTYVSS